MTPEMTGQPPIGPEEGPGQMFARSAESSEAERELTARVGAICDEFLRRAAVSSAVEFRSLAENFTRTELPETPAEVGAYLDELAESVINHAVNTSAPRFVGHMTSALPYFVRPLSMLVTALNQNQVKVETSKAFTPYERQALAQMHRLVYGLDAGFYARHVQRNESTLGMIVSGGTQANLAALWVARNQALGPAGDFAGVESLGLPAALDHYGYRGAVLIGSRLMHYSLRKAADLLGLGALNVLSVGTDSRQRVNLPELRSRLAECRDRGHLVLAVVGVAGSTDSGSIDPLADLAGIAREAGVHFHVDAAWGGALLFSTSLRGKLAGIELADSVTIDGHKQLYLPVGIGMLILRDPGRARAIEKEARYIVRAGSLDLGKRAPEGSRPATVLLLHAALRLLGRRGYETLVDESVRKAQYLAAAVRRRPEFELLFAPETNIMLYRYLPRTYREGAARGALGAADNLAINQANECLQKAQRRAGRTFVSRTTSLDSDYGTGVPIVALRAVIANPLTTERDLEAVLDDQLRLAAELHLIP